jgi:hypothetical protein
MDLPDELLWQIVQHLPIGRENGFNRHVRLPAGTLALSACCKEMRRVIFNDWVLREIEVNLGDTELFDFASMSPELRSCIK